MEPNCKIYLRMLYGVQQINHLVNGYIRDSHIYCLYNEQWIPLIDNDSYEVYPGVTQ